MTCARHIGVCSWSLRVPGPAQLVEQVQAAGLTAVQLALDPLRRAEWQVEDTRDRCQAAGIRILSGMMAMEGEDYSTLDSIRCTGGVRPDHTWDANLAAARQLASIARTLDLPLVTCHAGFIPHDPTDPERATLVDRLRRLADVFHARDIRLGLETGQETADTLLAALDAIDHPALGVNFDPANMILYGMGDPVDALRRLGPRILQCHVKDALPAPTRGEWGTEVPVGEGAVDWPAFFATLDSVAPHCDLVIEREAGDSRVADVRTALGLIRERMGVAP
ncbi:MAG: TIM barrel protein [Phycisphaerales bacterium]|nr:TIM barrel protein [Phycisphaerales bacterium]